MSRIVIVILSILSLLCFGSGALADCVDPGTEPITQERLDELIGEPGWYAPNEQVCCCYNNSFEFDHLELDHTDYGHCCGVQAPNCYTGYYITYYDTVPTATEGLWNVDNDEDGDWDEGPKFKVTSYNAICYCNGTPAYCCFLEPQVVDEKPTFICEDCDD